MSTNSLSVPLHPAPRDLDTIVRDLTASFAATAVERDARGGTPKLERDRLRQSGLLGLGLPTSIGGFGASHSEVLDVVRRFARVDPSIAHVFGFHHLLLETVRLFGGPDRYGTAAYETVRGALFWGNALNPKDARATLRRTNGGRSLDGIKSFCSGAKDSDRLVVSAVDSETGRLVVMTLPTDRKGIRVVDDWDAMGQRQTDSGTVEFHEVEVRTDELLVSPGPFGSTASTLRPCYAQAIFAHIFLGIAEGALEAARSPVGLDDALRTDPRDILRRHRAGEVRIEVEAASALAARAAAELDRAFERGASLTGPERGSVALAIAAAKVSATRASLAASSGLFELLGARSTATKLGLDRHWRNARTHTLHDPVDVKLLELGTHALYGEVPLPSFYS